MSSQPKWVRFVRANRTAFKGAGEMLRSIQHAREGGVVSRTLFGLTVVEKVVEAFYPDPRPWTAMSSHGLQYHNMSIAALVAKVMFQADQPESVSKSDSSEGFVWRNEAGTPVVGVVTSMLGGVDLFLGEGGAAHVRDCMQMMWQSGNELSVNRKKGSPIVMSPMDELGPYIAKRGANYYVERMKRYGPGPRTILIRGPTGVGKSVLARHISKGLGRGDARTLKISSEVLKHCAEEEVRALADWLRPTVLLLDDLDLDKEEFTAKFLALLETVRSPNTLVICTMMTHHSVKEREPKRGSWHFPGVRPGRVDETFTLYLPDADGRLMILKHYVTQCSAKISKRKLKKIARAAEGLSGAYLSKVVERLEVHGQANWREEVNHVLYMAPSPGEEGNKGTTAPEDGTTKDKACPS